jgi:PmbA protein
MARVAPEDPSVGLAEPDQLADDTNAETLDLCDPADEPSPASLEDIARRAEAAALAVDGVAQVESATAVYGRRDVAIAASNGFRGAYQRTDSLVSASAISGEGLGMERDYAFEMRTHAEDMPTPESIGALAGQRAVAMQGARQPPTGAVPVVFDERVASSLINHLLAAINGAAIARGSSWLRDALGQAVLPPTLSVTETPHRKRSPASRLFDAEGLATQTRDIVRDGVLTGWTLDLGTARKLGMTSTGNAARGTSGPPQPTVTNIALTEGVVSRDELLAEMGTGLLVTSMIGSTINPNTGDYSRGASGFWVENGQITYPINECTLAGNLRDMLMRMTPANDARKHLTRVVPSLLVEGLTLAGN